MIQLLFSVHEAAKLSQSLNELFTHIKFNEVNNNTEIHKAFCFNETLQKAMVKVFEQNTFPVKECVVMDLS
jgi:hypothetical protein